MLHAVQLEARIASGFGRELAQRFETTTLEVQ